jgi:hypothetical protein
MSCAACSVKEAPCKVSLTTSYHEPLCTPCDERWKRFARLTKTDRNPRGAAVVRVFRRWCTARKARVAA